MSRSPAFASASCAAMNPSEAGYTSWKLTAAPRRREVLRKRRNRDTAVDQALQVRPDVFSGGGRAWPVGPGCARPRQDQDPARNARDQRDVAMPGAFGDGSSLAGQSLSCAISAPARRNVSAPTAADSRGDAADVAGVRRVRLVAAIRLSVVLRPGTDAGRGKRPCCRRGRYSRAATLGRSGENAPAGRRSPAGIWSGPPSCGGNRKIRTPARPEHVGLAAFHALDAGANDS